MKALIMEYRSLLSLMHSFLFLAYCVCVCVNPPLLLDFMGKLNLRVEPFDAFRAVIFFIKGVATFGVFFLI